MIMGTVADNAPRGRKAGQKKVASSGLRIASAAHELKNPLEAMTALVYLLQRNPSLDQQAHQHVDQLSTELDHIRHIINQTLGLYRQSASRGAIRLREMLDTILAFYAHKIQFKQITVDRRYACDGLIEAFFPEELRQVFTNLVVNALEALPLKGSGRLAVHIFSSREWTRPESSGVRVVIAYNGSGIRQEHREQIFQPHFTTKEKGTGLGLWLSAGIIRKHGGSIHVRSSTQPARHGTVFSVFLPTNVLAQRRSQHCDVRASELQSAA
jgi:signal transduction histidine kinase